MEANSRPISSSQDGVHRDLAMLVQRHIASPSRRPVADHSRAAFERLPAGWLEQGPLILDSFCGTGQSTALLAQRFPDHCVLGVDKSAARLARHAGDGAGNYHLLRADCEDVWQLLLEQGVSLARHYLLYPNPWPKPGHLQRRVHGSAALPRLLQLGGRLELRSNWQVYVEEFGLALQLAGHPGVVTTVPDEPPLTLFEQKYRASGHRLWRFLGRASAKVAQ